MDFNQCSGFQNCFHIKISTFQKCEQSEFVLSFQHCHIKQGDIWSSKRKLRNSVRLTSKMEVKLNLKSCFYVHCPMCLKLNKACLDLLP